MERDNAWNRYSKKNIEELENLCSDYRHFLDNGKTERECVSMTIKMAEEAGYKNLETVIKNGKKVKAGDKVYASYMGKSIVLFHIGKKPMEEGMNILGAHIDSPRLDIKQNPLYEDTELAYLDTHYYGGIKKYQWVTLPMAIHGVVAKKDGTVLNIVIGEEEDFISAELEVVPAGKAKNAGLDSGMIMAYGQDDRVCAYTSLAAMLSKKKVDTTACLLLVDKEEIGSVGATGMKSRFFENTLAELLDRMGCYSELILRRTLANSKMLSSDVSAAFDPTYASVFEKKNAAYFSKGIVINKFTGSRGKSGSNDANAEYISVIRNIFEKHNVAYQTAELGKVDQGGGGTIAYIMALYGMNVIDSGVAVLNMHAPYEVVSKADVYEAMKAYAAFISE